MAAAPAWMNWIKPAPKDDAEREALLESFNIVVENVRLRCDNAQDAGKVPTMEETLHGLLALPDRLLRLPETRITIERLGGHIRAVKGWGGPKKQSHPVDIPKRLCLVFCNAWLQDHGKETTPGVAGTLPNVALAVWFAAGRAGIPDQEGHALRAMSQMLNRMTTTSRKPIKQSVT